MKGGREEKSDAAWAGMSLKNRLVRGKKRQTKYKKKKSKSAKETFMTRRI